MPIKRTKKAREAAKLKNDATNDGPPSSPSVEQDNSGNMSVYPDTATNTPNGEVSAAKDATASPAAVDEDYHDNASVRSNKFSVWLSDPDLDDQNDGSTQVNLGDDNSGFVDRNEVVSQEIQVVSFEKEGNEEAILDFQQPVSLFDGFRELDSTSDWNSHCFTTPKANCLEPLEEKNNVVIYSDQEDSDTLDTSSVIETRQKGQSIPPRSITKSH